MPYTAPGLESSLAARYIVEREIGEGASAHVLLARDTKHDRRVALKILRPELASALSSERFLREIRVAAGLQHPNILALYDSGETTDSLYFVMPYVEGETLRHRIERDGPLPVADAARILTQIADALTYAHSHGIVHRDVKPENILLADGHACIGDFGIAYAVGPALDGRLTEEGRIVGTIAYMSPEQAAADEGVDGRSDQYSLACVFHEMLTGHALFAGRTPRTAMSKRLRRPLPRLRKLRHDVPSAVDRAVARALAVDPNDRFPTVLAFAAAVEAGLTNAVVGRRAFYRAAVMTAGAAVAAIAVGVWVVGRNATPPLDRSLYAVMPFVHHAGGPLPSLLGDDCQLLLGNALSHWRDLRLVDELRVKSAYAEHVGTRPTVDRVLAAARALGAGRLIWGDVRTVGDSIWVRAALYDVGLNGRTIRTFRIAIGRELTEASARFRQLADSLVLHVSGPATTVDAMGTTSLEAWRAFAEAHRALGAWDLDRALIGFARAVELDPQYSRAHLGLAQTLSFSRSPNHAQWREAAANAIAHRDRLAPVDREIAAATLDIAEARFQDACGRFRRMLARDSLDFRAWHGLAECQAADPLVVADPQSPSGWRFRSSQAAAIAAYSRALRLTPMAHRAFRGRAFARLGELFYADMTRLKTGYRIASTDTLRYGAFPSVHADTLAFVPWLLTDLFAGRPETQPATQTAAVTRNRALVHDVTSRWLAAFPSSPDAAESHARSLEAIGELSSDSRTRPGALQVVRRARSLSTDPSSRAELGMTEVRLLLKTGAHSAAARLADSLVSIQAATPEAHYRTATHAALLGRIFTAATRYANAGPALPLSDQPVAPSGATVVLPPSLARTRLVLTAYAAFGTPADSIRRYWDRAVREIASSFPPDRHAATMAAVLKEAAAYAEPVLGPTPLHADPPAGTLWIIEQDAALDRGERAMLRRRADEAIAEARANPSIPFSMTYMFHTARQSLSIGDSARAAALLDVVLDAIPTAAPTLIDGPVEAATLVRAMALRADLAAASGDGVRARRWASAVATLWQDPDSPVSDITHRMRGIAARFTR